MPQRTIRRIRTLFALALVSATIALAQSTTLFEVPVIHASQTRKIAQQVGPSKGKFFVVIPPQR